MTPHGNGGFNEDQAVNPTIELATQEMATGSLPKTHIHTIPARQKESTLAGPGKPGPPAKGHEQVEYHRTKIRVLELYDQGLSKAEIARQIGYRNRTQACRMVDRIMQEELVGAGRDRLRRIHFGRLEGMWASVEAEVIKDDGSPVDERKLTAALKILEREARLTGIDGPAAVEQDEDDQVGTSDSDTHPTVVWVRDLMQIQAEIMVSGIGNGTPVQEQIALVTGAMRSAGSQTDDGEEGLIEADVLDIPEPSIEDVLSADPDPQHRGEAGKWSDERFVHWWEEPGTFFEDDDEPIDPEPDYGGGWAVGQ